MRHGVKTLISTSYIKRFEVSFSNFFNLLRIEKAKRLCNSLFWGSGLRPDAVCKDPPTALRSDLETRLLAKAECAVNSPM